VRQACAGVKAKSGTKMKGVLVLAYESAFLVSCFSLFRFSLRTFLVSVFALSRSITYVFSFFTTEFSDGNKKPLPGKGRGHIQTVITNTKMSAASWLCRYFIFALIWFFAV
jgi:hypothetical protein